VLALVILGKSLFPWDLWSLMWMMLAEVGEFSQDPLVSPGKARDNSSSSLITPFKDKGGEDRGSLSAV
jgi:hypothetical protein